MEIPKIDELPREKWLGTVDLYQWEGSWYYLPQLKGAIAARSRFESHDDDVLLASTPKSGTTWLVALISTIMNRTGRLEAQDDGDDDDDDDNTADPLTDNHPNVFMPSLESEVFRENSSFDISGMLSPRLFRTHMPYKSLPDSVKNNYNSKIVYITRDPKDAFVSFWHFMNSNLPPEYSGWEYPISEPFESFCKGVYYYGPFHDHVIGYWEESVKRPEKILFLKYEDMIRDTRGEVKKLASFLGRPFVKEEELDRVLWRCSLERLKNLEVNKNGVDPWQGLANSSYFRKGVVGDWKNHLSVEMKEKIDEITCKKFVGSGLEFETSSS